MEVFAAVPHEKQKRAKAFLRLLQQPQRSNSPIPQCGQKSVLASFRSTGRSLRHTVIGLGGKAQGVPR